MTRNLIATEYDKLTLSEGVDALEAARRLAVEHVQSILDSEELRIAVVTDNADFLIPDYYETYVRNAEDWDAEADEMISYAWSSNPDLDPRVEAFHDAWLDEATSYAEEWKRQCAAEAMEVLQITESDLSAMYAVTTVDGMQVAQEIRARFGLKDDGSPLGSQLWEAGHLTEATARWLDTE